MLEQKSRANWLNTENARCDRTVYITMQNVTSKLQIGLSAEMGWYPVSFIIIVNKDVWMCTPGRCSWALFKNCLRPLRFSLHSWCLKSFLFWLLSIRYRSCFFHSCIFHSRIFSAPVSVLYEDTDIQRERQTDRHTYIERYRERREAGTFDAVVGIVEDAVSDVTHCSCLHIALCARSLVVLGGFKSLRNDNRLFQLRINF